MWPGMDGDYNCFVHSDKIQISRQSREAATTSLSPSIVQAVCTGRGEAWIFARQNIKRMRLKLFWQSMKFFVSYVRQLIHNNSCLGDYLLRSKQCELQQDEGDHFWDDSTEPSRAEKILLVEGWLILVTLDVVMMANRILMKASARSEESEPCVLSFTDLHIIL